MRLIGAAFLQNESGSPNVQRRTFPAFQAEGTELAEPGGDGADDALVLSGRNSDRRRRAILPAPCRRGGRAHHIGGHGRGSSGVPERSECPSLSWRGGDGGVAACG